MCSLEGVFVGETVCLSLLLRTAIGFVIVLLQLYCTAGTKRHSLCH